MAGSALHLSRLSRGIGEVKTNGHEKVDVVLEPEDYYNLIQGSHNFGISLSVPEYDTKTDLDSAKHCQHSIRQIKLPKTFTTRKGALLLFSEDFAHKLDGEMQTAPDKNDDAALENLNLKTVDEFTKSILAFGSSADSVNLHFIHNVTGPRRRQFRPGYSARRYLSKLTRCIDFNILDSLVMKGHVREKSLFQTNTLTPSLCRRINDDVSYPPAPYRIMKTMLMAPGLLSGFTFYKMLRESPDLTTVKEDDETQTVSGITARGQPVLQLVNEAASSGSTAVTYKDLSSEHKGGVLADLLVKSAINHALEKHQQVILNESTDKQAKIAGSSTTEKSESHELPTVKKQEVNFEFNMDEALQSYLGAHVELPADHISHNAPPSPPESSNYSSVAYKDGADARMEQQIILAMGEQKPDLTRSDTLISNIGSYEHSHCDDLSHQSMKPPAADINLIQLPFNPAPIIPPIPSETVPELMADVSNEATFNSWPVLPSIGSSIVDSHDKQETDDGMTAIHIQPATADSTIKPHPEWVGLPHTVTEDVELHLPIQTFDGARLCDLPEVHPQPQVTKTAPAMPQDILLDFHDVSHRLRGNVLHTKASTRTKASTINDKSKQKAGVSSVKGSVIFAPDGKLVSIGGSIARHETESAVSDLAQLVQLPDQLEIMKEMTSEISEEQEEVWGQKVKPPHADAKSYMKNKEVHDDQSKSRMDAADQPISEQQLLENLTEHAHTIAQSILSQPGTGLDLTQDAQAAIRQFMADRESGDKSGIPSVEEYQKLLRDTLASVVSQVSGDSSDALKAQDARVTSELLDSLIQQHLMPGDIEIGQDQSGRSVIRVKAAAGQNAADHRDVISGMLGGVKEGHIYQEPKTKGEAHIGPVPSKSIQSERVTETDVGEPGMFHYGERETPKSDDSTPDDSTPDSMTSDSKTTATKSAGVKSVENKSLRTVKKASKGDPVKKDGLVKAGSSEGQSLGSEDKLSASDDKGNGKPKKSTLSDKTAMVKTAGRQKVEKGKSVLSKDESKEEFIVGKVKDPKELENLYGTIELPAGLKDASKAEMKKKPQKDMTTGKKKTAAKKGAKAKKSPKSGSAKASTVKAGEDGATKNEAVPAAKTADSEHQEAAPVAVKVGEDVKSAAIQDEDDFLEDKTSSETVSDDMEFTIIRDEFPDSDEESKKPARKSLRKSSKSSKSTTVVSTEITPVDTGDESDDPNQTWTREARAAKREAQATQRRQLVAQRRRQREEQLKREKEEAERREQMERELEADHKKRMEQRRLDREHKEQAELDDERAERAREHQARQAADRERRQKEEYQRKMDEMRRKQAEEDIMRKQLEERRQAEAAAAARLEAIRVSRMLDAEREEYERRRQIEEEERLLAEQMEKLHREAEAQATLEAARKLARELAEQQATLELRLRFNRQLHLEEDGLTHTQTVSRAFVFSYYQLLKWLGLELPSFEHFKESHPKY